MQLLQHCPGPGGSEEAAKGQLPLHLIAANLHVAQHGLKPGTGLATRMISSRLFRSSFPLQHSALAIIYSPV